MHFSLELIGYGICFGSKIILADITLNLPAQGISVLMGPVGTGKSTLLGSLTGINDINPRFKQWGSATLNGQPIGQHLRPVLVRQQLTQLSETVESAILRQAQFSKVNLAERRKYATQLVEKFAAEGLIEKLNQRLIDLEPVWQRMALIVAAAASTPELLMIDEPTTGLNASEAALILKFIRNLGLKQKILVVLHSQTQARELADDIILLAGGRVQFHGSPDAFFGKTPPNDIVKQFVLTGSVSIAAPDARREELADDAVPPPPLPQAAIEAIRSFSAPIPSVSNVVEHKLDVAAASATIVASESDLAKIRAEKVKALEAQVQAASERKKQEASAQQQIKQEPPKQQTLKQETQARTAQASQPTQTESPQSIPAESAKRLLELPMPSKNGVSIVAEIGKVVMPASLGPKGFSWIVPGMLAGCPMPGVSAPMSYDLDLLVSVGITVLITLTEEDLYQAELKAAGLTNLHLPIYDREAPSLTQMHMLLFKMQKLIEQGEVLAVHCLAGIGRTGTVLAAWMIKEGGLAAEEAIRRLRLINPSFVQTEVQEVFLADFENDILRRMR